MAPGHWLLLTLSPSLGPSEVWESLTTSNPVAKRSYKWPLQIRAGSAGAALRLHLGEG